MTGYAYHYCSRCGRAAKKAAAPYTCPGCGHIDRKACAPGPQRGQHTDLPAAAVSAGGYRILPVRQD